MAFPTETVYGLGADATNTQAIQKVFAAKQRPTDHPLIVHIGDVQQLSTWARAIPDCALLLAPGIFGLGHLRSFYINNLASLR